MINNQKALAVHDSELERVFEYVRSQGHSCSLPSEEFNRHADKHGWDFGNDGEINGRVIDFKSFGLKKGPKSYWWDSNHWRFRNQRRFYPGQITQYFVHKVGNDPSEYLVARASSIQKSRFDGGMPWYPADDVVTLKQFLEYTAAVQAA